MKRSDTGKEEDVANEEKNRYKKGRYKRCKIYSVRYLKAKGVKALAMGKRKEKRNRKKMRVS